jgi:hypothetical protein
MADAPLPGGARLTRREAIAVSAAAVAAAASPATLAVAAAARPLAPPIATAKGTIAFVCRRCGGREVTRDAWAAWDIELQDWVVGALYDYAYCHDCDDDTRLLEVDPATLGPTGD